MKTTLLAVRRFAKQHFAKALQLHLTISLLHSSKAFLSAGNGALGRQHLYDANVAYASQKFEDGLAMRDVLLG